MPAAAKLANEAATRRAGHDLGPPALAQATCLGPTKRRGLLRALEPKSCQRISCFTMLEALFAGFTGADVASADASRLRAREIDAAAHAAHHRLGRRLGRRIARRVTADARVANVDHAERQKHDKDQDKPGDDLHPTTLPGLSTASGSRARLIRCISSISTV